MEAERIACPVARPVVSRPVVSRPAQRKEVRLDVPAGFRREHLKAQYPARPSVAAARKVPALQATEGAEAMVAQRLAQAERPVPPALQAAEAAAVREAQQAPRALGAQPSVAAEVWDVVVAPQPVAESAEVVARPREAAVQGAAEVVQRRAAGQASVAARPRAAEVAALDAEEVRLREAEAGVWDVAPRQVERGGRGVLLLAAASVGLPSTRLRGGRLAPSTRVAHARGGLRTAQPSGRWWQAARGEDVS
jgi:hypothetical protein